MAQSVNDFGLFRGATVTDAGQLQQIMVSTPTRRSFVAGYEGTSEGLDRCTWNGANKCHELCWHRISYLGISALDQPAFDIAHYFHQAAAFIDSCGSNGNVLVHCLRGRSRSAAVVLAYLMMRRHIPAPMAMKLCCSVRAFHINIGFLEQLAELHNSLCRAANN
ncbi:Dual specificity protein phosphatase 3 [Frankliniella fusca]|uniref:protein-serine/threonine phosphatase n=1 Tax=Frankliniella fusca TaxID=407009 RepID=A0AAE1LK93_9NEOP|nr:Dual specificity protein phosphatase 3 [Frankliniella fusca]